MTEPIVSVIIPVYNCAAYVEECLASVIKQTYNKLDIIIVNDGSVDASQQICEAYAKADDRITILNKENGGLSDARNHGIKVAKGELLTFVDGDDVIDADMIRTMVSLAEKESADIVKIGLTRATALPVKTEKSDSYRLLTPSEALQEIYSGKPQVISACGKLFKKELFDNILFPVGRNFEDEFTTPKLYYAAKRIVFSERILYYYMQRNNESIIRGKFSERNLDIIYVMAERISFFKEKGFENLYQISIIDYYCHIKSLKERAKKATQKDLLKKIKEYDTVNKKGELTLKNRIKLLYIILTWKW